jgi:hypothetical protein
MLLGELRRRVLERLRSTALISPSLDNFFPTSSRRIFLDSEASKDTPVLLDLQPQVWKLGTA